MRRAALTAALAFSAASPAFADCPDPYACMCPPTFVGELTLLDTHVQRLELDMDGNPTVTFVVDRVHNKDGTVQEVGAPVGEERTVISGEPHVPGRRVIFAEGETGPLHPFVTVVEGMASCGDGFELSPEDTVAAMLSDDCRRELDRHGFEAPECVDNIGLGCGCSTAEPGRGGSVLALLLVLALRRGRSAASRRR